METLGIIGDFYMLNGFYICVLGNENEGYSESRHLERVITEVCMKYDIVLKNAMDYHSVGRISEQLLVAIEEADVIFADANSSNKNVWYEIGYSDKTDRKKVICLAEEGVGFPFDRSDIRSIKYSKTQESIAGLEKSLGRMVKTIVCNQVIESIIDTPIALAESEIFKQKLTNHFESDKLRRMGATYLKSIIKDNKTDLDQRGMALYSLKHLHEITSDILLFATQPILKGPVKGAAYEIAVELETKLPHDFWKQGLASVMETHFSSYMKALVSHWTKGNVDDIWLRTDVVNSSNEIIRNEFLSAIIAPARKIK
jgi:hypothetical protein